MKKFCLLLVCALLSGAFALSTDVYAQSPPKFKSEEEQKAYEAYYNAVYVEKNKTRGFDLAKSFVEKFPDSCFIASGLDDVPGVEAAGVTVMVAVL